MAVDVAAEVATFRLVKARLRRDAPEMLLGAAVRWIEILDARTKTDRVGELMTTFVDEFFIAREVLEEFAITGTFAAELAPLKSVRADFLRWAREQIARLPQAPAW
jgi:hypothetical protein